MLTAFSLLIASAVSTTGAKPLGSASPFDALTTRQADTRAVYDRLSYRAAIETLAHEPELQEPLMRKVEIQISVRGDTRLITVTASDRVEAQERRENGVALPPGISVRNVPQIRRFLLAPDHTVAWLDASAPVAHWYRAENWRNPEQDYMRRLAMYWSDADLRTRCFGTSVPIGELIGLAPEYSTWRAEIQDDGLLRATRTPKDEEDSSPDMIMLLDPETGLMRETSLNSGPGNRAEYRVTYTPLEHRAGAIPVPATYEQIAYTRENRTPTATTRITFSNFRDESDQPEHTIADLGMPEGCELQQMRQSGGPLFWEWNDGDLRKLQESKILKGQRRAN
ncbi:MAG: hypothetical protein KF886_04785 [Candidatus Hydrogenedentes bacterium]|nr:hypothetical protein [Candidatus Hydrogenedentota bacterium]